MGACMHCGHRLITEWEHLHKCCLACEGRRIDGLPPVDAVQRCVKCGRVVSTEWERMTHCCLSCAEQHRNELSGACEERLPDEGVGMTVSCGITENKSICVNLDVGPINPSMIRKDGTMRMSFSAQAAAQIVTAIVTGISNSIKVAVMEVQISAAALEAHIRQAEAGKGAGGQDSGQEQR